MQGPTRAEAVTTAHSPATRRPDNASGHAAEPWSDGNVGMYGASYMGATQWLAATLRPPHLKAIAPAITASDYHDGWTYQGGAFEQWFNQSWTSGLAQDTLNRKVRGETNAKKGMWTLPLSHYSLFNFDTSSPWPTDSTPTSCW